VHLRKAKFFPAKFRGSDEDASKLKVNKVATFVMIAASLGWRSSCPGI
jgi:hypothetical protein